MEEKMRQNLKFLSLVLCFFGSLFLGIGTVGAASEMFMSTGEAVYIPAYSHIYSGDREHPFYLTTTLSVRNTDTKHAITILPVDYYDSKGKLLKPCLENPVNLKPLATNRYIIKESDKSGGSGANFIVKWKSNVKVNAPIIESIMIGTKTQQGISFISRGRVIQE